MDYGSIFVSVRQRVAAFQYWKEFTSQTGLYGITESDYLDEVYRFLYTSASRDFIEFCADKEGMEFHAYCRAMGIEEGRLA